MWGIKIVLSFVRKEEIPLRERTDLSKVRWESTKPLESLDYLYFVISLIWFNRTVIVLWSVLLFTVLFAWIWFGAYQGSIPLWSLVGLLCPCEIGSRRLQGLVCPQNSSVSILLYILAEKHFKLKLRISNLSNVVVMVPSSQRISRRAGHLELSHFLPYP